MNPEKLDLLLLRYLFVAYKKGPSVIYPINDICAKYNADPIRASDHLIEQGLIRERWIYSGNEVACRITIQGIEKIDPIYVRTKLEQIIGGLADSGNSRALLEILENKIEEFSIASDFVNELSRLGLVKISNPNKSIVVELTPTGWQYYERGKGSFLTLVA